PQSPIPNPQSPIPKVRIYFINLRKKIIKNLIIQKFKNELKMINNFLEKKCQILTFMNLTY
ncbi:hypothetical protein, partial [uncultured Methanobrevibacter sp.]|uniref:hypothetical protein n=1 Tax=uncultured Methanobrevibacter sp. TaxID=253161 RepID=UPI0026191E1E